MLVGLVRAAVECERDERDDNQTEREWDEEHAAELQLDRA
jgi:hypothetical protein